MVPLLFKMLFKVEFIELKLCNFILYLFLPNINSNITMAEEYLQEKVRGIIEPMINALLTSLPEDPV